MNEQLFIDITIGQHGICGDIECYSTDYKHQYILSYYSNNCSYCKKIIEHPFYVTLGHFDKCFIHFFYDSKQKLARYIILPHNYESLNITDISNQLYREYLIYKLNGEIAKAYNL